MVKPSPAGKPAPKSAVKKVVTKKETATTKARSKAPAKSVPPAKGKLEAGQKAPAFTLPSDDGKSVSLKSLAGKKVVLYFYPKDDTPGCTVEALGFTALKSAFEKAGTKVIGISKDSVAAHCKFRDKHKLSVTLVSDETGETLAAYGVWCEKKLYGRIFMGITRSTFLIDEKGLVAKVWSKVKVDGHPQEVLAAAKGI
jgi:peroxiredoxin Q/BCP